MPAEKPSTEEDKAQKQLNLQIADANGEAMHFKVKGKTKFSKIFDKYAASESVLRDFISLFG